jgi:membrane protease YdiL (CAAX protease family)
MSRVLLAVEMVVLFVGLPLGYRFSPGRLPALPILWLVAAYGWWMLKRDGSFDMRRLWNAGPLGGQMAGMLLVFAVVAALLWVGTHWFEPQLEWGFVKQHPRLWAVVMVLYPILSVYPQGILYRAFFLHRYAAFFPDTAMGRWALIVASAAAFGFLHIIFRNPLAVVLTLFGGVLFAWRYETTGSLLTSSVEHSLYGCWLFTVGLGQYFYHGVWPEPR